MSRGAGEAKHASTAIWRRDDEDAQFGDLGGVAVAVVRARDKEAGYVEIARVERAAHRYDVV